MDHRSPLESIFSAISGLPRGHDKPVKYAVYNSVALFLLFLCGGIGYAVYMILEPFIKPLIWAVLVGSALHPLKRSLQCRFKMWLETLERTKTPVILGIVLLPTNIVDSASEFIGANIWKRLKLIIIFGTSVLVLQILYCYTPNILIMIISQMLVNTWYFLNFLLDKSTLWTVSLVLLGYFTTIFILWKPDNNINFHYASIMVWLICLSCIAQQFGALQVPVFILSLVVVFGGFLSEVYSIYKTVNNSGYPISVTESLSLAFHDTHLNSGENSSDHSKDRKEVDDERADSVALTKAKEGDPWSLELFENEASKRNKLCSSEENQLNVMKTCSHDNVSESKNTTTRLRRSLSQPQFDHKLDKGSIFKLSRKMSITFASGSLVDAGAYESTFYLYSVLWACIIMLFWKNVMLNLLLPLPILFYMVKHLGLHIGLWSYLNEKYCRIFQIVSNWCQKRHDALVPVPIRGLYNVLNKINTAVKIAIKQSLDTAASFFVIFGLIFFLICASVFITLQIYAEAIMLAQMTGNVINQTVVHNPELRQLLPPAWDETIESILDNAYQYGREGLSKAVKGMMSGIDSTKSEHFENQVLELWDRIYQKWMSNDCCIGPKVTEDAVQNSWDNFMSNIKKSPEMFHLDTMTEFGKQNIGTLLSLLESVWGILKGNITLILSFLSSFVSLLLGGGFAVLNFILNIVVFLTTLFYLLNNSGDLYKPVEMLTNLSPSGKSLGYALEEAVIGVFSASLKMASFYGMWTWFIHNLFGVKIVYIPTAFATILGAVPFLGTYWACIPAVLDLWLAEDRAVAAIAFAIIQFLPTSVVDTTIYKEIKGGGHPYLTGLAIAGGIFWLGIEGAIMGPMLLCGLYVAINLSSSLLKESSQ